MISLRFCGKLNEKYQGNSAVLTQKHVNHFVINRNLKVLLKFAVDCHAIVQTIDKCL